MTRIMLHIGTHKTGTTALQGFLFDNDEVMAAQGFRYFKPPMKYDKATWERNGQFLLRYAKDQILPEKAQEDAALATEANLAAFKQAVEAYDTIVLSEEVLWYEHALRPDTLPMIQSLLESYGVADIQVFVYLRRQDEYASSLWNQRVKDTVKLTIPLSRYVKKANVKKVVDYAEGLKSLTEIFGRDNVHVRLYNRADLVDGDIRNDFCSLIGLSITPDFTWREKGANISLSNNVAAIRMQANKVESYRAGDNFLYGPSVRTSALAPGDGSSMFPPEQRREFLDGYVEGNAWIAKEFFARDDGALFDMPESFPEQWELDTASFERDAIRLFTDALTVEHGKRLASERRAKVLAARVKVLEKQVRALEKREKASSERVKQFDKRAKALEKQAKTFDKRAKALEKQTSTLKSRTDRLAAGEGILSRVRRKVRRVVGSRKR